MDRIPKIGLPFLDLTAIQTSLNTSLERIISEIRGLRPVTTPYQAQHRTVTVAAGASVRVSFDSIPSDGWVVFANTGAGGRLWIYRGDRDSEDYHELAAGGMLRLPSNERTYLTLYNPTTVGLTATVYTTSDMARLHRTSPLAESYSLITYSPGLQNSNDMEPGVTTVNAVAEPAVADYSKALTIPASPDSRLVVQRIAGRLLVHIDAFAGGGTTLNYRVKRNGVSIATGVLEAAGAAGDKLAVWDIVSPVGLGAPATYTVYLWVNAGSCDVSLCQVWAAVGTTTSTDSIRRAPLALTFDGMAFFGLGWERVGTGTFCVSISRNATVGGQEHTDLFVKGGTSGDYLASQSSLSTYLLKDVTYVTLHAPSVPTDMQYIPGIACVLRSVD